MASRQEIAHDILARVVFTRIHKYVSIHKFSISRDFFQNLSLPKILNLIPSFMSGRALPAAKVVSKDFG